MRSLVMSKEQHTGREVCESENLQLVTCNLQLKVLISGHDHSCSSIYFSEYNIHAAQDNDHIGYMVAQAHILQNC